jgi:hypothetical protein
MIQVEFKNLQVMVRSLQVGDPMEMVMGNFPNQKGLM